MMDSMSNWGCKHSCCVDRVGNSDWGSMDSMMDNWSSMVDNWSSMVDNWSMVDNRGVVDNRGSMDSMVNNRGSVDNRGVVNNWGSMDNRGVVSGSSWGSSIAGNSFIGNINNISRVSICAVVDNLSSAIRKSNSVGARGGVAISLLLLGKVSSAVVIVDSILVSIESWLS